jgi:hypothetical protein
MRASALEPGRATAGAGRRARRVAGTHACDGGRVGRGEGSRAAGRAARARRRAEQGGRAARRGRGRRACRGGGRRAGMGPRPNRAEGDGARAGRTTPWLGRGKGGERREEGGEDYRAGARAISVEGETCAG